MTPLSFLRPSAYEAITAWSGATASFRCKNRCAVVSDNFAKKSSVSDASFAWPSKKKPFAPRFVHHCWRAKHDAPLSRLRLRLL